MDYTQIKVNVDERVGVITLSHNPPRNSFTKRMLVEVLNALDEFEENDTVRCVMMNSEGPNFSMGADFDDIDEEWSGEGEIKETFSELGSGFNLAMQDLDIRGAGNLLGAEQSGFMEDLGYETYQKILNQAVTELKNDEFADMYAEEMAAGNHLTGDAFVEDCAVESDLEMYFPDTYVPGSAERMLLYRELDNISDDAALDAYRQRLIDRFGAMPHEGEELLQVVPLRRYGKSLGCEKIILKQGRMQMQFVSNPNSAYYKSATFDKVLNYIAANARRCDLKEVRGKRYMVVNGVPTVGEAVKVLLKIKE